MLEVVSTSREDELRSRAGGARHRRRLGAGRHARRGGRTRPRRRRGPLLPVPRHDHRPPERAVGRRSTRSPPTPRGLTAIDGVHGVDLLAYRHATADVGALTRAVADAVDGPVIAAGSVATTEQIAVLEQAGAWGFTIGSAIFEARLPGGPSVAGQVARGARPRRALTACAGARRSSTRCAAGCSRSSRGLERGREAAERAGARGALRGEPGDGARGRPRAHRGRVRDPAPRRGHVRRRSAPRTPRARQHGLLHGDDPRRRQRAGRAGAREEVRDATPASARRSGWPTASASSRCERLRLADGRPVILSRDRIPEGAGRRRRPRRLAVRRPRVGRPPRGPGERPPRPGRRRRAAGRAAGRRAGRAAAPHRPDRPRRGRAGR